MINSSHSEDYAVYFFITSMSMVFLTLETYIVVILYTFGTKLPAQGSVQ